MWLIESTEHANFAYARIDPETGRWMWMYNPDHGTRFDTPEDAQAKADFFGHTINARPIMLSDAQAKRPKFFPACT